MKKKQSKEPVKEPVKEALSLSLYSRINILKSLYSSPKIYRYSELINGKKKISTKKQWHVYYYYRNPYTGLMQKFTERKGINRLKTVTSREEAAKNLQKALKRYLQDGYNPFIKKEIEKDVNTEIYTVFEAVSIAFNHKKNTWKESTIDVNTIYFNSFLNWIEKKELKNKPIATITRKHISFYLGYLVDERKISNTSRNNHKRLLSSLFSELEEKEMISYNFIPKIAALKSNAKKNKPFNNKQLIEILEYTKKNDPYLYDYIKIMWYSFLRPIEIIRLKVKNIDLTGGTIEINSKTNDRTYIRIVKPLQEYFKKLELHHFDNDMFIVTKDQKVGCWETKKEKSREDWFSKKFKKIKEHFNLSNDYGIYSFRHTSALNVYYKFKKDGLSEYESVLKVQEIMRHADETTTRKYLREIGGQLPDDWSSNYEYKLL
ncbi:tyrosine-type recombinase/integrase [Tenacibaculum soleae]|uniref:tyrosine-type recombinase/integrase n=1 Tax=Tenacibaculum soleae TaxID=447689 RepID=UPI002300F42A|nr:site-specific integrase [Tenacibaculum soleae]